MNFVEIVVFILIKNNKVLAEKRKKSKKYDPGLIVIPGGSVEDSENHEEALIRELKEELEITTKDFSYVCSLLRKDTNAKIHYFILNSWSGEIKNNEAEKLLWIPLKDLSPLSLEIDRTAIKECFRNNLIHQNN